MSWNWMDGGNFTQMALPGLVEYTEFWVPSTSKQRFNVGLSLILKTGEWAGGTHLGDRIFS